MRKTRSVPEMIAAPICLFLIMQAFATAEASQPAVPAALESATAAELTSLAMVADFEDGFPTGWFRYADGIAEVTAEVITVSEGTPMALPGQVGSNNVLSVTANVPTWAGLGAVPSSAEDWSNYDGISFWFYGENSATTLEFEIQTAQDDNRRVTIADTYTGWRQLILPFSTFGAGGTYDVTQVDGWLFVLDGTIGSMKLDNMQLVTIHPFANFNDGRPGGWFQYGDAGTVVSAEVIIVSEADPFSVPGQMGTNGVLSVTANVPTWAGFGAQISPVADWSKLQGVCFWFYGENSDTTLVFEMQTVQGDNRQVSFVDDFIGWQLLAFPFTVFGTTAYDVSQVNNWVLVLDGTVSSFKLDDISAFGDVATPPMIFSNGFENLVVE